MSLNSYKALKNESIKEYMFLSNILSELIIQNNPKAIIKDSHKQKWNDEFRKLIEIDKRSIQDVKRVIIWCQESDFWKHNILSAGKLREKWNILTSQMLKKDFKKEQKEYYLPPNAIRAEPGKYDNILIQSRFGLLTASEIEKKEAEEKEADNGRDK